MSKLTPTQRRTVRLMMQGMTRKEIAHTLGLNHNSIRWHTCKAQRRLGCRTPEQMFYLLGQERHDAK
jgi:DNA-binding CsgD family transcriptional regulator